MSTAIDVRVSPTGTREAAAGVDLAWPAPVALAAPRDVPGFGPVMASVGLDAPGGLSLPVPARLLTAPRLIVQVVVGWSAVTGPATVVGGDGAFSLRLFPAVDGSVSVEASVRTGLVQRFLRAPAPVAVEAIAISVIGGGSDAVLIVDAFVADRRPLPAGAAIVKPPAEGRVLVGDAAAGGEVFGGRLFALRVADVVPDDIAPTILAAADGGLGELDAYYDDHQGPLLFGEAIEPEQHVGGVRYRNHRNATLAWSASTGAHDVRGPMREQFLALGGPLGSLGLPSSDELSVTEFLDLVDSKRRTPGRGLRLDDVLVDTVPQVSQVLDVADLGGAMQAARSAVADADRGRSWAEVLTTPAVGASALAAPSALVSVAVVAEAAGGLSPQVMAALETLTATRFDARRGRHLGLLAAGSVHAAVHTGGGVEPLLPGGGGDAAIANQALQNAVVENQILQNAVVENQILQNPVENQILPDPVVADQAVELATSFVRNTDLVGALSSWSSVAERQLGGDASMAGLAELIADADRHHTTVRLVNDLGGGVILRGPRAQRFEHGVIIWSASTRAIVMTGDILLHWLRHGGSDGFLGLPRTILVTENDGGRSQDFVGGRIYWSAATGAHEVHGDILQAYFRAAGTPGVLGRPTSDEEDVIGIPGARRSTFEHGDIYWSPGTGAHWLAGDLHAAFVARGGVGRYGLPVTDVLTRSAAGVDVRHVTFASGEVLASVDGVGVFDKMVLDMGSVRSSEIDDEVTSDDQPELWVETRIWVNGTQVVSNRTPESGSGGTQMNLDAIAPVDVPLRAGASVRVEVKAWDEDSGIGHNDQFAAHDVTYTFDNAFFGWLDVGRGGHPDAPSTWDSGDAEADTFKVSYTLTPPFDEPAHFDLFRQEMYWSFENPVGPDSLGWQMFADTFENVLDSSGSGLVDNVLHPGDRLFYGTIYKGTAKKGNCFGMSLLAADTFHRRTGYPQPLRLLSPPTPDLLSAIHMRHGVQQSELAIVYKTMVKTVAGYLDPRNVFKRVKRSVDARTPILLDMRGRKDAKGVGHSTLAYRTDDSGWPRKIWLANPNTPWSPQFPDDTSRIEIGVNGSFRMYEFGKQSTTYGAGAYDGTLGDSYLYDIPVAILQPPWYTPDWLLLLGIGIMEVLLMITGDAEVRQVRGGDQVLFGDHRGVAKRRLENAGVTMRAAASAGLLTAVEGEAPRLEPAFDLGSVMAASAMSAQFARFSASAGAEPVALADVIGAFEPGLVEAARESWASAIGGSIGPLLSGLDDSIGAIDDSIDISAVLAAGQRVFTPGAWPEMSYAELEDTADGELYTHRGPLPDDFSMDLLGRGGTFSHTALSARTSAMVHGPIAHGATDTVRYDRLSTSRPGVRVETSEAAKALAISLSMAVDGRGRRWVGWNAEVTTAAGGASAGLTRADAALGVVVSSGAPAAPIMLTCAERLGTEILNRTRWMLPAQGTGDWVAVEPVDPASPFGPLAVDHLGIDGALIERTVVDPMP